MTRPKDYKRARTSDSDTPTTGTVDSGDEKVEKTTSHKKNRNVPSRNSSNSALPSKRTTTRSKAQEKTKDAKKDGTVVLLRFLSHTSNFFKDSEQSEDFTHKAAAKSVKAPPININEEHNLPVLAEVVVPDTPAQGRRIGRSTGNGRRKGAANKTHSSYRQSEDPDHSASPMMTKDISQAAFEKVNNTIKDDGAGNGVNTDKANKPRVPQPKASIADMSKRVNAIMEFIQHTQVEMALKNNRPTISRGVSQQKPHFVEQSPNTHTNNIPKSSSTAPQITVTKTDEPEVLADNSQPTDTDKMHSTEIMDALTRKLVHWQQTFGTLEKA